MIKVAVHVFLALVLVVTFAVFGLTLSAQTPPDIQKTAKTGGNEGSGPVIAPLGVGTAFNALLDDTLDTRKTKAGDSFTAETAEDVSYQRCMIFPKGTKIVGHVVRASAGGHGQAGSAIFVQFDKATTKDGQEVILNAGIQALAVAGVAPMAAASPKTGNAAPVEPMVDESAASAPTGDALVVSTLYPGPRSAPNSSAPEGQFTSNGLFSENSKGAFGRPDMKVYTPTSEGSHGTVLLSSRKNMHLDAGTHLLLVVQPPPNAEPVAPSSSPTNPDPQ
jgi:hypothetical protein